MASSARLDCYYQCFVEEQSQSTEAQHYEFLNFKFYLRHQIWLEQQQTLIPCQLYEGRMTLETLCKEFFQSGITNLRRLVAQPALPDNLFYRLMPQVISYARRYVENCSPKNPGKKSSASTFTLPLRLNVIIDSVLEESNEVLDRIITESMNEIKMVPASQEAIRSLKRVNLETKEEAERCSICLEDWDRDSQVLAMPCKHVYHQECIMQWLKTSHVCPLCRYQMPV